MGFKARKKATSPLAIGNSVLIRTVTHYHIGRIVGLDDTEILLEQASWIACTARFANSLAEGILDEVEPFPNDDIVSVARGACVDVVKWNHALPREQK